MNLLKSVALKRSLVISHDLVVVAVSWTLAFLLRYDFNPPEALWDLLRWSTPAAVVVFGITFRFGQLYAGIWRYASIPDLIRIMRAVAAGSLIMLAIVFLSVRGEDMPRSVFILHPLLLMVLLGLPRMLNRFWKMRTDLLLQTHTGNERPILLIGAGDCAELLLRDSIRAGGMFRVVGMLDDDPQKQGLTIHNVPVLGNVDSLPNAIQSLQIAGNAPDEVVIAIPSASRDAMRHFIETCERANIPYRTAPALKDIVSGRVQVGELREVTIEDILGRASIKLDEDAIKEMVAGRRILITGAGGSIGSELCRQIARFNPETLVLFEQSEFNLYEIDREVSRVFPEVQCQSVLGDCRSSRRVKWAIETFRPETVLHAAAYKHVPLLETNATEGIRNNILGTRTVARMCVESNVPRFVMVSTDKAVNPVNVMGATKRLAEIYCQNHAAGGDTKFITVRFGNVLGSVGSVVPLFKEQIRRGGPVTITHPDMQRYFMTIPEASQLVLQAATLGKGGEVFVLDMGKPVKIVDLATDMIRLSGKEVDQDIQIEFTGLRPGEKLYEELLYDTEELSDAGHEKIFLSRAHHVELDWLEDNIEKLLAACEVQDEKTARSLLEALVPQYRPAENGDQATESSSEQPQKASAAQ